MAKGFEKGALIVLVLVFAVGAIMAFYAVKDQEDLNDVIDITDARTEYLLKEVNSLKVRVKSLERNQ